MVQDQSWTHLRYVPGAHSPFFEHLPFGFWPMAWALSWFGEFGPNAISAAFSLLILLLVYRGIRSCDGGHEASLLGVLIVVLTPDFHARAGHPYLDQSLTFFATAALLPILPTGRPSGRGWLVAFIALVCAVAIKGPFGLVPFAGVISARSLIERSLRTVLVGGLIMVLAAVPAGLFVILQPEWLEGFGRNQLLASASGARVDGRLDSLYPLRSIIGHFWPGMALLVPALWAMRKYPASRSSVLGLALAAALVALCLPTRKVWSHSLVIYPLAAIFLGLALSPVIRTLLTPRVRAHSISILAGIAVFALLFAAVGGGRSSLPGECALSRHFAREARDFRVGETVLVVDSTYQWGFLSSLASHYSVVPVLIRPGGAPPEARHVPVDVQLPFLRAERRLASREGGGGMDLVSSKGRSLAKPAPRYRTALLGADMISRSGRLVAAALVGRLHPLRSRHVGEGRAANALNVHGESVPR